VFHPSEQHPSPQGRRTPASASYHVGLDTMMGRRSRHRPEEVAIDGFLLLDTGEYELVIALIPLDVFWKMKALDILGHVRTANRARAAQPAADPDVGSVWLVDGELEPSTSGAADNEADTPAPRTDWAAEFLPLADEVLAREREGGASSAGDPEQRVFRLQVRAVYSLDRVAIEPKGPRFIETLHVRDMLPAFKAD
jgi:hypothetical protein